MDRHQSINSMLKIVEQTIDARTSRFSDSDEKPRGPLFTFLIGAGFSVTAGVSSVQHLVLSLEKFKKNRGLNWFDIFDQAKEETLSDADIKFDELTEHYFALIEDVLPLPQSRHDFITAAIQWASARKVQINIESILLATLLIAGTGGEYPKSKSTGKQEWMARSFAKHVFTTNFDEVMPTTFYLGNSPVEIIDRDSAVNLLAEYPTLVYLHGRHLHFKMRNTKHELKREIEENDRDLFQQFRDVLRNTGLIVIGYAGAKDKVSQMIQDAIEDPESLPYGLWWNSYKNEEQSIHADLLQSIKENHRSFILEQGKDAEQVMRLLSRGVGIDDGGAIGVWKDRLTVMNQEVNRFIDRAAFDFNAFNMTVAHALLFMDNMSLENAHKQWLELNDFLYEHEDKFLVIDILSKVSRLLIEVGNKNDLVKVLEEGILLAEKENAKSKQAYFLIDQGVYYNLIGDYPKSRKSLTNAIELLTSENNKIGLTRAYTKLIDAELLSGKTNEAKQNLDALFDLSNQLSNEQGLGEFHYLNGKLLFANKQYSQAQEQFEFAFIKHGIAGEQRDLLKDRIALAKGKIILGNYEEASLEMIEVNKIAQISENHRDQIKSRLLTFVLESQTKKMDPKNIKELLKECSTYFNAEVESEIKSVIAEL
jgi:tetratricopeptide (TPR) repeat protein